MSGQREHVPCFGVTVEQRVPEELGALIFHAGCLAFRQAETGRQDLLTNQKEMCPMTVQLQQSVKCARALHAIMIILLPCFNTEHMWVVLPG